MRKSLFQGLGSGLALLLLANPAAQAVVCGGSQLNYAETGNNGTTFGVCGGWGRCQTPTHGSVSYTFSSPGCDPTAGSCTMTATVNATFPGNHQNNPALSGFAYSFAEVDLRSPANALIGYCGTAGAVIQQDLGTATVTASVSCGNPGAAKYALNLISCPTCPPCPTGGPPGSCVKTTSIPLDFAGPGAADCPMPPPDDCNSCGGCVAHGGGSPAGCSTPVRGGGPACGPAGSGPGAHLFYRAGGAGGPGLPGSAAWKTSLGLYWSHEHAQRIVVAPNSSHVWLITERGSFREFGSLASGSGLRLYQSHAPSDEYRKLYFDTSTGGWQLDSLDGRKEVFRSDGLWSRTVWSQNGVADTVATYNGSNQLTSVDFPDGRSEDYTYDPSGKLATITEQPVAGSSTSPRTWTYTWSGDELVEIERPDGTSWEFSYASTRPGYLTEARLIGTDNTSTRIEAAFEYDNAGNLVKSWKGDSSFTGTDAVSRQEITYDDPAFPAHTEVEDWLDASSSTVTEYDFVRDPVSLKARVDTITGDCPVCGTGPNSQFTYGDSANPLLPTQVVDGRGLVTQMAYDANGRTTSRTEAVGTGLQRLTSWQYSSSFPALLTQMERPSTSGGSALRVDVQAYDSAGNPTTSTIQGAESGGSFSLATATTYNSAGRPLTVDPPGYSTTDQTSWTYDSGRGDLIALTRTDPLVGTTTFDYDGFNRRILVTDPNGVDTVTGYDDLDRVTGVTQVGASSPADDLVTSRQYTVFGDLFRTVLPEGNLIEYGYDTAGRMISIERRPDASTRGERTLYTLNTYGQRTQEAEQRWNGSAWVTESFTDFVYTSRCRLDKAVRADGSVLEYTYDCNGNLEKIWDENHPRASFPATPTQLFAYDALNRVSTITQPWTGTGGGTAVTTYAYDVQSHRSGITDAEGNVTSYTYSDRDLVTQEVSPVSGTTTSTFNDHGQLVSQTDARSVTAGYTLDAADRVTALDYADNTQDTAYTYGSNASLFNVGRLISITRNSQTVGYAYDRFGRITQDGALSAGFDKNGNLLTLGYPNGVTATYTYDFADRQATLSMQDGANPSQILVSASTYQPQGPLASLTFGNGLTETRGHDDRYLPTAIDVGSVLSWSYTHDAVGHPTAIVDNLNSPRNDRAFDYQDPQYFLTQGDGPWGLIGWTYDKIGNVVQERSNIGGDYFYTTNGGGGNTPILDQFDPGFAPVNYTYDAMGNRLTGDLPTATYGDDRRLAQTSAASTTDYAYDGRGLLRGTVQSYVSALRSNTAAPTYSSDGLLLHRYSHVDDDPFIPVAPETNSDLYIFYFAGRPVATLDNVEQGTAPVFTSSSTLSYFTVDHLGTPILMTDPSGAEIWQGGFDPYGRDYSLAPTPLRLPGQWRDYTWDDGKVSGIFGPHYNVNRWYDVNRMRYTQPDPLGRNGDDHPYSYVRSLPTFFIDPLGLVTSKKDCASCCTPKQKMDEHGQAGMYLLNYWPSYVWTPARIWRGGSCLTAAEDLHRDVEKYLAPKCWVTSVQLTRGLIGKAVKAVCGVTFPVHYVVKYSPCDGKGSDWALDGYTGPNWTPLPPGQQIEDP